MLHLAVGIIFFCILTGCEQCCIFTSGNCISQFHKCVSYCVIGRGQGDRADGSFHGGIVGAVGGQDNGIGGNSRGGGRDSFGGQDNRLGGNFHGGGWGTFGGQDNRVGGNFRGGGLGHFGGQDNRVGRNLRDGGHGTFGGGRSMSNTGRNNRKKLTVKDLDAELDQYRSEAKKAKSDSA